MSDFFFMPLHLGSQTEIIEDTAKMMVEAGAGMFSSLFETENIKITGIPFDVVYNSLMKSRKFQYIFSQSRTLKSNDIAVKYRMAGNEKYRNNKYLVALKYYTKSIQFAENGSSCLGLAYANRSAVLFEKKYYWECLQDIERALGSEYPEQLKSKLLNRQQVGEKLKPTQKPLSYYHVTPCIMNKNSLVDAASDAVEIQTNEKFGRHIVATRDVKLGEIIVVEKPYVGVLLNKERLLYCHECFHLCYNMIPCEECTTALYCSENCKTNAFRTYHKYECNFVEYFHEHPLIFLKMVIVGLQESKINNTADNDNIYRSNRFKEIKALTTNEDKKNTNSLLLSAFVACLAFHSLKSTKDACLDFDLEQNGFLVRDLLFKCAMIENYNSYGIMKFNEQQDLSEVTAGAVYSVGALFDHSCVSNCARYFHGSNMVIRARVNIKKGSQCTLNYGPSYFCHEVESRHEKLQSGYFLNCNCRACVDKWPTLFDLPLGREIPDSIIMKVSSIRDFGPNDTMLKDLLTEASVFYDSIKSDEPCQAIFLLQTYIGMVFHSMVNKILKF